MRTPKPLTLRRCARAWPIGCLLLALAAPAARAQGVQTPPRPPKPGTALPAPELAEVMPEFPGGYAKLLDDIVAAIKYPPGKYAAGRWFLRFVVADDGRLGPPEAVPSPSNGISKNSAEGKALAQAIRAALRQTVADEAWTPGRNGNQPVAVAITLPLMLRGQ